MKSSTRATMASTQNLLQRFLVGVRWIACGMGYVLAYIGWVTFGASVFFLMLFPKQSVEIAGAFSHAGDFLLPAWFLLRFAEGQFPFGRRLFR